MLEATLHGDSSFWTFTYDKEHVPSGGSLDPADPRNFLKRLRLAVGPVRYFLVGEYGDETYRPHYHAALFGVGMDDRRVDQAWGLGHTFGGELTPQSAAYIAGYVTKKMVSADDPRLGGKHPEFARMSLRPGIGAGAIPAIGGALNSSAGALLLGRTGDVPLSLSHGKQSLPLGRYLRRKLREEIGFDEIGQQPSAPARQAAELQSVCEAAGSVTAGLEKLENERLVKVRQAETKAKIWSKKGSI